MTPSRIYDVYFHTAQRAFVVVGKRDAAMSAKQSETDKEILKRVMSEPTFEKVREAAIRENAKRKQAIRDLLRQASRPMAD